MILRHSELRKKLQSLSIKALRANQGSIEFRDLKGKWKSIVSHYDPAYFSQLFIDTNFKPQGTYFIYGIGDGQLVTDLLKIRPDITIYILETNLELVKYAEETYRLLQLLEKKENAFFCASNEPQTITVFLESLPKKIIVRYYTPSIHALSDRFETLKNWLNNRMIDLNSNQQFKKIFKKNLSINRGKRLPDVLRRCNNKFPKIPCLITMAGPTVREILGSYNSLSNRMFVISAGRNSKMYKEYDIKPDLWVEMDPQEKHEIWERLAYADTSAPLTILDSSSYLTHDYFKGKVGIVHSDRQGSGGYCLATGKSTVAAFALELAIHMGFDPIILAGQDLCYLDGKSHIDSLEEQLLSKPQVLCNDGQKRESSKEFIRHIESIQKVVNKYNNKVFTCSTHGAKLAGVKFTDPDLILTLSTAEINKEEIVKTLHSLLDGKE